MLESANFLISALVRWADEALAPLYIVQKGDAERGLILLHMLQPGQMSVIWVQDRDESGQKAFRMRFTEAISRDQAEEFLARECARDEDLWLVEIENSSRSLPPVLAEMKA